MKHKIYYLARTKTYDIRLTSRIFYLLFFVCINSFSVLIAQEEVRCFEPSRLVVEHEGLEERAKLICTNSCKAAKQHYSGKYYRALKEKYEARERHFLSMLEAGDLIIDGELYDYVQSLVDLVVNSLQINEKRKLYLVRDDSPNAFNIGDDQLYIHLGLIYRVENEDQLVFVIAHELGHNELNHYDSTITRYADLVTNDSIQRRIKAIKYQEYRTVSTLNEIMLPWLLSSKEKSRLQEREADDYGFNVLEKCGYSPWRATGLFDIFENSLKERDTTALDLVNLLNLEQTGLDFSEALDTVVESSLGIFKEEKDTLEDLLRTHPHNEERKAAFLERISEIPKTNEDKNEERFLKYRSLAEGELIVNALYKGNLDRAIFYSLRLYEREPENLFVRKTIPFSFAYLGYEKKKRRAGKRIANQSPYYDSLYNYMLYFLREISPDQCFSIAQVWNKNHPDLTNLDLANASMIMMDVYNERYDDFWIRYHIERERSRNYYVMLIINQIKDEEYIKK
ncbi:MAG: M48 family metalloprotease [Crocinitomicaceae bacterium]|nr:M48 family metalloprotease [Crocinitomicaceae bacterium]